MKKKMFFAAIVFLMSVALGACGGKTIGNETPGFSERGAEESSSLALATEKGLHQTFTGWDFKFQYSGFDPVPRPVQEILPDTLNKAMGKQDNRTDNTYYIAALDLTLDIPDGYYLYRTDGMYVDENGRPIRMEFVDEYVVTLKECSEAELADQIYNFQDPYDPFGVGSEKYAPSWVVWNFKIVHRDYYPVEQLFQSRIRENGEVGCKGEYLILFGTSRLWYKMNESTAEKADDCYVVANCPEYRRLWEEFSSFEKIDSMELADVFAERYGWPVRIMESEWFTDRIVADVEAVTERTGIDYRQVDYQDGDYASELLFYNDPSPTYFWTDYYRASLFDDDWWESYQKARTALQSYPEQYACPPVDISFVRDSFSDRADQTFNRKIQQQWKDWIIDPENEISSRSYTYAWLQATGREYPLENIVVFTKQSENDFPLFLSFVLKENGELLPVLKGVDVLSVCDIDFSRSYVEQYLSSGGK